MNILEEYLQRHNIHNIPTVHHCNSTFAIAKPSIITTSSTYLYITVNWVDRTKGPGNYQIDFKSPQKIENHALAYIKHSDFVSQSVLFKNLSSQTIEYDEYENFMFDWYYAVCNSETKWVFANSKDEARLMLWESFVYIFDFYFSEVPYDIKSYLWESLNLENSIERRIQYINSIMDYVGFNSRLIFSVWAKDMYAYMRNYNKWISNLFSEKKIIQLTFNS